MAEASSEPNFRQAVPFFGISNMDESLRFYVDGLGFELKLKWEPEGRIRWCYLENGRAGIMLQEYKPGFKPDGKLGLGMSVCFILRDAIAYYHEIKRRGIDAERPFVGNGMWVTGVWDPDGYRLEFESETDVPEETVYEDKTAAA